MPTSSFTKTSRRKSWCLRLLQAVPALTVATALCAATGVAQAEAWPSKPVRVVVPYGPGGIADISARSIAADTSGSTGQSVIVGGRPAADTPIGTEAASREPGHAHVMLLAGGGRAVNNARFDDLRYNTAADFVPLG